MRLTDLRPISELARCYGVKSIIYGKPGTGKTPIIGTAPRPVVCFSEPGMLSVKHLDKIPGIKAYQPDQITDFFNWLFSSHEARNFDTVAIDSLTQIAEIFLDQELKRNKDGRKAYGEMARRVLQLAEGLYYMENKHIYIICKQMIVDDNGCLIKVPYFPGKELNVRIPHLFDEVFHIDLYSGVPGAGKPVVAIRAQPSYGIIARDRSGKLNEFEFPNLTTIFNKCMQ